ncbi:MAG TPA: histidine kinase [Candidatus Limnocylindrales bacterium]|jgi:signal transduction histidine kinase
MPIQIWIQRSADVLLAGLLTVVVQAELWLATPVDPDEAAPAWLPGGSLLTSVAWLAFTASLVWRRRAPLPVLVLAAIAIAAAPTASLDVHLGATAALMVATYSAGADTRGRSAIVGAAGVALLIGMLLIRAGGAIEEPSDVALPLALLGGPWLAGLAIRERRDRALALEDRAAILEREREEQARAAVADERARIALEMHDIVAHALSVIVVQARGARRALADDPDATRASLTAIEETGSAGLGELRRLLGALSPAPGGSRTIEPGLEALDGLLVQVRQAGLQVEVTRHGQVRPLPSSLDRAAYRIVQEALTNVLAHAQRATTALVGLDYGVAGVAIDIRDDGVLDATTEVEVGLGISGMRARATELGGSIEAGALPGGGYLVRAWLPIPASIP